MIRKTGSVSLGLFVLFVARCGGSASSFTENGDADTGVVASDSGVDAANSASGGTSSTADATADAAVDAQTDSASDAKSDAPLDCDALDKAVQDTLRAAQSCAPALSVPQCDAVVDTICCPTVVRAEDSPERRAYEAALDRLLAASSECFFDCPAVVCDEPSGGVCVPGQDGSGTCVAAPGPFSCEPCQPVSAPAGLCDADEALWECLTWPIPDAFFSDACRDAATAIPRYCCEAGFGAHCSG